MQFADLGELHWESYRHWLAFFEYDGSKHFFLDGFIQVVATVDHWELQVTLLEPGEELRWHTPKTIPDESSTKRRKTANLRRSKNAPDEKFDENYPYRK